MPINRGKGKEDMVSIYNKILFSHEKKMPFAAIWIKLETIILGEVRHRKTNVVWYSLYMQSKIKDINQFIKKKQKWSQKYRKQTRLSGDKWGAENLGYWEWHIYTTIYETDN